MQYIFFLYAPAPFVSSLFVVVVGRWLSFHLNIYMYRNTSRQYIPRVLCGIFHEYSPMRVDRAGHCIFFGAIFARIDICLCSPNKQMCIHSFRSEGWGVCESEWVRRMACVCIWNGVWLLLYRHIVHCITSGYTQSYCQSVLRLRLTVLEGFLVVVVVACSSSSACCRRPLEAHKYMYTIHSLYRKEILISVLHFFFRRWLSLSLYRLFALLMLHFTSHTVQLLLPPLRHVLVMPCHVWGCDIAACRRSWASSFLFTYVRVTPMLLGRVTLAWPVLGAPLVLSALSSARCRQQWPALPFEIKDLFVSTSVSVSLCVCVSVNIRLTASDCAAWISKWNDNSRCAEKSYTTAAASACLIHNSFGFTHTQYNTVENIQNTVVQKTGIGFCFFFSFSVFSFFRSLSLGSKARGESRIVCQVHEDTVPLAVVCDCSVRAHNASDAWTIICNCSAPEKKPIATGHIHNTDSSQNRRGVLCTILNEPNETCLWHETCFHTVCKDEIRPKKHIFPFVTRKQPQENVCVLLSCSPGHRCSLYAQCIWESMEIITGTCATEDAIWESISDYIKLAALHFVHSNYHFWLSFLFLFSYDVRYGEVLVIAYNQTQFRCGTPFILHAPLHQTVSMGYIFFWKKLHPERHLFCWLLLRTTFLLCTTSLFALHIHGMAHDSLETLQKGQNQKMYTFLERDQNQNTTHSKWTE